jgi:hypothetical protein
MTNDPMRQAPAGAQGNGGGKPEGMKGPRHPCGGGGGILNQPYGPE